MAWFLIVFLALAGVAVPQRAEAQATPPSVAVVDGDTLEVSGETVRLYGIDAPELGQFCQKGAVRYRCGYEAALMLRKLVGSGPVECRPTPVDADDDGRICSVGLVDLAEAMLRNGYAVSLPSALAVYRRAESDAKKSSLGIWRGDFARPAEWRAGYRLQTKDDAPRQICDIKGIVSDTGERVYLVPSDPEYDGIDLILSRGEQLFCSDDQAEIAGWRRWPKSAIRQRAAVANKPSE